MAGEWTCPHCGNRSTGRFCGECGAGLPGGAGAASVGEDVRQDAAPSAFVGTFETGRHYKVHRSYIWVGPVVAVFAVLVIGALNSVSTIVQLAMAVRSGEVSVDVPLVVGLSFAGLVVLLGIVMGLYALAWRNMSYVFDDREFSYYSGIVTKRRVHVPYARVQSVNHRASIVQRLAGVCTVTIDSAGGSSNKAVRVPYLRLETAERLRAELFTRKAAVAAGAQVRYVPHADTATVEGAAREAELVRRERSQAPVAPGTAPAAGGPVPALAPNVLDSAMGVVGEWRGAYGGVSAVGEEPVSYEHGLRNDELLLTALSHDMPIALAAIIGISMVVSVGISMTVGDEFSRFVASAAVPIVAVATLVSWACGLVGIALSYGNFRARRRGSRIEVERGLLAREFSGIDVARVQSVEVRQSVVRRLMGYCELSLGRIDAASEGGSGNNNSRMNTRGLVIHPFVKVDRVDEILDGLVPELRDRPRLQDCRALPKVAVRRALLRRCLWYNWALWATAGLGVCWAAVLAVARPYLFGPVAVPFARVLENDELVAFLFWSLVLTAVLCAVLTAVFGAGAVIWARRSGYAWNRRYLLVHNDGLSTATSIVPRAKIQSAATRDNPFQRRLALTSLLAVTAAGTTSTTVRLLDVPAGEGRDYLDWAKPRGGMA